MGGLASFTEPFKYGDKTAISVDHLRLSYKEVAELVKQIRLSLNGQSIDQHERIGLVLDNRSISCLLVLLAVLEISPILLLIDNQMKALDLQHLVRTSSIKRWIVPGGFDVSVGTETVQSTAPVYREYSLVSFKGYDQENKNQAEEPCLLQATSGTGGRVKLAKVPYSALDIGSRWYDVWFGFKEEDNVLSTVPLHHSFGLIGSFLATLRVGATFVHCVEPTPRKVVQLVHSEACTVLFGVPLLLQLLESSNLIAPDALESLRLLISSGAKLESSKKEAFDKKFSKRIQQVYGSTETGVIAASSPDVEEPEGAVGLLLPDVEWKDGGIKPLPSEAGLSF